MISIQRILCPTDLSRESDEALRYAIALAQAYNAKLILLNCTKIKSADDPNGRHSGISTTGAFEEALSSHLGLSRLEELNWEPLWLENVGDVGKVVAQQAFQRRIDLIVMRSRRRPHAAMLLGSTAETVCREAPCPVLVTHPQEREWVGFSTGEIDLNRILVAYDFSTDAKVALDYGLALAQEYQTELHLLHVLSKHDQREPWAASQQRKELNYLDTLSKLQRAVPPEALLWCRVSSAVRYGKPYEETLAYAKEQRIDLICVGASTPNFNLGTMLGSNVDRILRQAPCPVLVTRPVKPVEVAALEQTALLAGAEF